MQSMIARGSYGKTDVSSDKPQKQRRAVSVQLAKEIMGDGYIHLPNLSSDSGFSIGRRLMTEVTGEHGEVVNEVMLHQCRLTHELILVPEGSILKWVEYLGRHFRTQFLQMNRLDPSHFSLNDRGMSGYHLVRRQLIEQACGAPCKKEQFLPGGEEMSALRTRFVYLICTYLRTGKRNDFNSFGICRSKPSGTCRVGSRFMVGHFKRDGMSIESWTTHYASYSANIAEVPDYGGQSGLATEIKL